MSFHTVPHDVLLNKLRQHGVSEITGGWVANGFVITQGILGFKLRSHFRWDPSVHVATLGLFIFSLLIWMMEYRPYL